MNILGETIQHTTYGEGVISDLSGPYLIVEFHDTRKKFRYPEAFRSHLILKNKQAQQFVDLKINELDRSEREDQKEKEELLKKRIRSMNYSIQDNSHLYFDLSAEEAKEAERTGRVFAGLYLSGAKKGEPKTIARLKPNTVCILTTIPPGGGEQDRRIIGACAVHPDSFGEDMTDGNIIFHPRHRLFLEKEQQPAFAPYLEEEEQKQNWGRTPYRYGNVHSVSRILFDLAGKTGLEAEFYEYFCEKNRQPSLIRILEKSDK